jgi:hypothetical protein
MQAGTVLSLRDVPDAGAGRLVAWAPRGHASRLTPASPKPGSIARQHSLTPSLVRQERRRPGVCARRRLSTSSFIHGCGEWIGARQETRPRECIQL